MIYQVGIILNDIIKNTFIKPDDVETIYIAIDGVPSKGKMIEQIHRKYSGQLQKEMNNHILEKENPFEGLDKIYVILVIFYIDTYYSFYYFIDILFLNQFLFLKKI